MNTQNHNSWEPHREQSVVLSHSSLLQSTHLTLSVYVHCNWLVLHVRIYYIYLTYNHIKKWFDISEGEKWIFNK